jgi:hypothetical protein
MNKFFSKFYWEDVYYNIKHGIISIFVYLPITWRMRDWDYYYILEMNKFQLKRLLEGIKNGGEVEKDRIIKEKDIEKCIKLIDNILKDEYLERVGYDHKRVDIDFIPVKDTDILELVDIHPEKYTNEEMSGFLYKSNKLQKKELKQLFSIIEKNLLGWWT